MMMERHEIIDLMAELKLAGMRHAYDEVIADALKRQHPVAVQPRAGPGGERCPRCLTHTHGRLRRASDTPSGAQVTTLPRIRPPPTSGPCLRKTLLALPSRART